jgi:adenylate cyclase
MTPSSSNRFKSQLIKIFWITVAWTMISVNQFVSRYATLKGFNCDVSDLDPTGYLYGSILTGLLAGVIGGSSIVLLWEGWLRTKNYGIALVHIFWSYCLIYLAVDLLSNTFRYSYESGLSFFAPELWHRAVAGIFIVEALHGFLFWLLIVLVTLIALQVNDKYGPGVFASFLLGRYFQPKREERIFMFLDLRSSTTIAEKLGEARYFNFIKDVFKDVTPAIIYAKGEIYQYVGDEIVVSWKMNNGIENANCIQCFFDVQLALRQQSACYEENYEGITPEFKAGLHYGYVMAGEVGVVKRDIAFSGDVLNTAARIQAKCNELGVNILLSKFLLDKLALQPNQFSPQRIGDMMLRGKQQNVILYTV